jgi:hypothetical protein
MRTSKKVMQSGKAKTSPRGANKIRATGARTHIRKPVSQAMKNKIWHNWLTEDNPFFEVQAPMIRDRCKAGKTFSRL